MNEQQYEYRTGQTHPDKSSRGLIALLLICVIFLGGLVSALSFMNIHLFRALKNNRPNAPLSFSQGEAAQTTEDSLLLEGMALQEPDPVYQQLHELPDGLYIARIEPDSNADQLGIRPGDVLISWNGITYSTLDSARAFLDTVVPGDIIQLLLYRNGQELSLTLTLSQ